MNFYALLGISQDADEDAIRAAYHELARQYHPDRGAGSSAEKFRLVTEAYQTLTDPARREHYDRTLPRVRHRVAVEPMIAVEPLCGPRYGAVDDLFDELLRSFYDDFFRW